MMTIPSRHIWKTITEIGRHRADLSRRNLHIGKTIRDLQLHTEEEPDKRIRTLLKNLKEIERKRQR